MNIKEINDLIDQVVNPHGGVPLVKGPAVNALLKRLAAEIASASADPAPDLRAALDTQKTRLDALVAGAPQALDTLAELAALLAADEQGTAALLATQQQHTQQLANAVHRTGDETIAGGKQFADLVWGVAGFAVPAGVGATTYAGDGHRAINQTYYAYSENGSYVIHSRDGNVAVGRGPAGQPQPTATFTNAGRLGLGTEAPQQQLHLVEGDAEIRLGAGASRQTPAVVVGCAGGKAAGLYAGTTYTGVNFSDDGYFTIAPQPRADFLANAVAAGPSPNTFVVRASGRVGVGTAAPREQLDVAGNVRAAQFVGEGLVLGDGAPVALNGAYGLYSSARANAGVTINRDNDGAYASVDFLQGGVLATGWSVQMQPSSPDLILYNRSRAASQLHLAAASGYVGVGTAAPREQLDVAGNVQAAQFIGDGSRLTGLAPRYDGPGPHTDGAMTQQATTAALAAKADLVRGRVPAAQLPDQAAFHNLTVENLDPESFQATGYQFFTDGRTLAVGWPDSGTEYAALGNGSCTLYAGDAFAELRVGLSFGKPALSIRASDRSQDGTLLIPATDPSQPTSAVTVQALQQLAFTPPDLRLEVAAGAFAQGERTGTAPAGSRPGMKFSAPDGPASYVYEYLLGRADTDGTNYAWVRTLCG